MKVSAKISLSVLVILINTVHCATSLGSHFHSRLKVDPTGPALVDKVNARDLYVGTATRDITPVLPAALAGQMYLRVATTAETPITANILVLDSRQGDRSLDVAVLVSCDLVTIPQDLIDQVRKEVALRLPDLNTEKVIFNATHTHTAAVVQEGGYNIPENVTTVKSYLDFLVQQVAGAIVEAWDKRSPGSLTWGMSYAKVAFNRRAVYADGSARMYGQTAVPEFRAIEGFEDQSINSLFFWNDSGQLIAMCINVASPAQVVESRTAINADYWHPVREGLRKRFGKDLCVLGWIGAAGDQTPRPMYSNAAEKRMLDLKKTGNRKNQKDAGGFRTDEYLDEIARRIITSVIEAYELVKDEREAEPVLAHTINELDLPMRLVTVEEYEESKKMKNEQLKDADKADQFSRLVGWYDRVIQRYENQRTTPQPMYSAEVHVIRIGDVVLCTNPFELFTEFGIQMKARSKALQTFVLQLAGPGSYLPTNEAVKGGHYSAVVQSNLVGPEGGQILVDRTVEMIDSLWP